MSASAAPPIEPFFWLLIILLSLILYVVLDGYDLGVGILLFTEPDRDRRKEMVGIIATAWDGNESWLVLLGVGLFGGFPLAYSILLPALYVPFIVMLLSLIFRGMSIEFQEQSIGNTQGWMRAFAVGSLIAAFCQGVIVGSIVNGFPTQNGHFVGTPFGFLNGFSLLTGALFVCLYALTGTSWLNDKTDGILNMRSRQHGRVLVFIVAILLVITVLLAPLSSPVFKHMFLFNTQLLFIIGATLLALVALGITWYTLKHLSNIIPFLFAVVALILALLSLLVINYPYLVPPEITLWQAASPSNSVDFLLIGVGFCIPIVLGYNAFAYYVFRGKFTLQQQGKV